MIYQTKPSELLHRLEVLLSVGTDDARFLIGRLWPIFGREATSSDKTQTRPSSSPTNIHFSSGDSVKEDAGAGIGYLKRIFSLQ